jgi:hypothetical protein
MPVEPVVFASALYWGVYVIGVLVAIPCAVALLFGIMQTARWFLRGGVNHLPGRHTSMTRAERAAARSMEKGEDPLPPSKGALATPEAAETLSPSRLHQGRNS